VPLAREHGTRLGYDQHMASDRKPCLPCTNANAARERRNARARRARRRRSGLGWPRQPANLLPNGDMK